jgi:hypothetical protein
MRVIVGSNAWNDLVAGLFTFNVNNAVGNTNDNNGVLDGRGI